MTELRSSSFNLRCRACHGEATYLQAARSTDRLQRSTSSAQHASARRNPLLRPEPKNLSRAANG